jgi:hypothetical protein
MHSTKDSDLDERLDAYLLLSSDSMGTATLDATPIQLSLEKRVEVSRLAAGTIFGPILSRYG